jgi:phosphatidylserine/phosphatidylglycerophosphate/cardiolipin synthase-like enzyme
MHLKSYQIDGRLLRTGAANFSAPGLKRQDNDLIVIESSGAAAAFMSTQNLRVPTLDNISVAHLKFFLKKMAKLRSSRRFYFGSTGSNFVARSAPEFYRPMRLQALCERALIN